MDSDALYQWMASRGCDMDAIPVRIAEFPFGTSGALIRGLVATRDIAENDVVMALPMSVFVSLDVASGNPFVEAAMAAEAWDALSEADANELAQAVWLIDTRRDPSSPWGPFAATLPSTLYGEITVDVVRQIAVPARRAKAERFRLKRLRRWTDVVQPIFGALGDDACFTADAWRWAEGLLSSRSFTFRDDSGVAHPARMGGQTDLPEEGAEATEDKATVRAATSLMLPLADMFNHDADGIHDFGFDPPSQRFVFRAHRGIRQGDQVFLRYTSISRWTMWKSYGFVSPTPLLGAREALPLSVPVAEAMAWLEAMPQDRDEIVGAAQFQWFRDTLLTKGCAVLASGKPNRALLSALRLLFLTGEEFEENHKAFAAPPLTARNEYQVHLYLEGGLGDVIASMGPLNQPCPNATAMNHADHAIAVAALAEARATAARYFEELRRPACATVAQSRDAEDDVGPAAALSALLTTSGAEHVAFSEWDGSFQTFSVPSGTTVPLTYREGRYK